jgi:non-ribosomal peptide synthetase component E (peptide arylation enzyme)
MPTTPDISVSGWFKQRALRSPERMAVTFAKDAWTYAQFDKRVDALAGPFAPAASDAETASVISGSTIPLSS